MEALNGDGKAAKGEEEALKGDHEALSDDAKALTRCRGVKLWRTGIIERREGFKKAKNK